MVSHLIIYIMKFDLVVNVNPLKQTKVKPFRPLLPQLINDFGLLPRNRFVSPDGACEGDVIVLTKPLGTQIAVNAHQWMDQKNELWNKISHVITPDQCLKAFQRATSSMARINRIGARLMKKHGAHCATDVTGYGILGHATNMAKVKTRFSFCSGSGRAALGAVHTLFLIYFLHRHNRTKSA